MFKKIIAICTAIMTFALLIPTVSLAAENTQIVYQELDAFEKATQTQLDSMIKNSAITASVNTDIAHCPQGVTSSIKLQYDHTKGQGYGQLLGFQTDKQILLDPVTQPLEGYEGLRFWISISGDEWGQGFDTLVLILGDWSWGYRTDFRKRIAIDPKGFTGYIDVKFSELVDNYYDAANDTTGAGPSTLPPNNIDYIGLQLEKTNGCYLPVDAYVSDIKAYKTVTLADKAALNSAITEADALKQADYLADSWTAFASALAAAKTVAADTDATAQEITKAVEDLKTAKSALKTVPQSSSESSQVSSMDSEESSASASSASQESSDSSDTPKTGDNQVAILMMAAALLSIGGILATRRKRKPSKNS